MLCCTLGFARRPFFGVLVSTLKRTKQVCVLGRRSSADQPFSLKPDTRLHCVSWSPTCHGKVKRCWTADALCRLDTSFTPRYDSEQDLRSPEALIPRGEEPSEDDKPFPPRFLLQQIIFAHSPYEGVYPDQPRLQETLLCMADWPVQRVRTSQRRGAPLGALVFLGPKQLFPSKQQLAHIAVTTGGFEWWERGRGTVGLRQGRQPRAPRKDCPVSDKMSEDSTST